MEGITGHIYRNAHHQIFPHIDKYFTPFITPTQTKKLNTREWNDILPERNVGINIIPQIMTNCPDDFIWAANQCREMGYQEINLNLGCPSGTVVSKKRGAGFLEYPVELDRFLDRVTHEMEVMEMKFSVKTRIGKTDPDEYEELSAIYNRYPLEELIIHPRVRADFYKNYPNREVFHKAYENSRNPVCYNGDLFNRESCEAFVAEYPDIPAIMLGRGIIANPGLVNELVTGEILTKAKLLKFHNLILEAYKDIISGDRNVLFKMKEFWFYASCVFTEKEKYLKRIRKANTLTDYQDAIERLFTEQEITNNAGFRL